MENKMFVSKNNIIPVVVGFSSILVYFLAGLFFLILDTIFHIGFYKGELIKTGPLLQIFFSASVPCLIFGYLSNTFKGIRMRSFFIIICVEIISMSSLYFIFESFDDPYETFLSAIVIFSALGFLMYFIGKGIFYLRSMVS